MIFSSKDVRPDPKNVEGLEDFLPPKHSRNLLPAYKNNSDFIKASKQ